jgi:hypothetical protein
MWFLARARAFACVLEFDACEAHCVPAFVHHESACPYQAAAEYEAGQSCQIHLWLERTFCRKALDPTILIGDQKANRRRSRSTTNYDGDDNINKKTPIQISTTPLYKTNTEQIRIDHEPRKKHYDLKLFAIGFG